MSVKDYDTKVPEKVKKENKDKMDGYVADIDKLTAALESMQKLL